jgi:hypothetical protein
MLNVLADDVVGIPTRLEVNKPIFKIAFADSSSNAKSNPLIKFSFATIPLIEKWFSSFCLLESEDDLIAKRKDDLALSLINGHILVRTENAITTIANISMIKLIIEIML